MISDLYLYDAVRTPRGKGSAKGALAALAPEELIAQLISALSRRCGEDAIRSSASLTLGCVGQVDAQGGHLALISALHAGLPHTMAKLTVNNFCVSGLSAIASAARDASGSGDDRLRIAGGVEMMSAVPFMADRASYYTDTQTARRLRYAPVALAADLMATREAIPKTELDRVTARSHQRAAAAQARDDAPEIITVCGPDGETRLAKDESVRADFTEDRLSAFPPAFAELGAEGYDAMMSEAALGGAAVDHVHSLANCPPPADGAALALIGSRAAGRAAGLAPKARIRALVQSAGDPVVQLTAGFAAMDAALDQAGSSLGDMDRIEFMEAFAAPVVRFERVYKPDPDRVNPDGGHLAMGHPMGASGAILATTLLAGLERCGGALGLAVAHGGSGVGAALVLERV
ncbi:MAG: acetyl-CoA C-acyltransferase [Pseudomonadota bacterium]